MDQFFGEPAEVGPGEDAVAVRREAAAGDGRRLAGGQRARRHRQLQLDRLGILDRLKLLRVRHIGDVEHRHRLGFVADRRDRRIGGIQTDEVQSNL